MLPSLWLTNASSTPPELVIREGEQVLGRSADADIRLDETFVSSFHARLTWQNSKLTVLDLDSTNGTLVNGVKVVGWTSLTDGDVIEFGGVEATVRLPAAIEPNPVFDPASHPPPPAPSSRRRPTGETRAVTGPPEGEPADTGPMTGPGPNGNGVPGPPTVGGGAGGYDITGHGTTRNQAGIFGSTLPSELSGGTDPPTEPLFDRPITSAITVRPTPPAGVSITGMHTSARGLGFNRDNDFDTPTFDVGGQGRDGRSSFFDNRGLRITVSTAILVFVALAVVAAVIIYLTGS